MKNKNVLEDLQDSVKVKTIVESGEIATHSEVDLVNEDPASVKSGQEVVDDYLGRIEIKHDEASNVSLTNKRELNEVENVTEEDSIKIAQKHQPETPVENPYPEAHPQLFG